MERYRYSNATVLAHTIAQHGQAVYGPRNLPWYYEADGFGPEIRKGYSTNRNFRIRWFTGDGNLGESSLEISHGSQQFRQLSCSELTSVVLRNSIKHKE